MYVLLKFLYFINWSFLIVITHWSYNYKCLLSSLYGLHIVQILVLMYSWNFSIMRQCWYFFFIFAYKKSNGTKKLNAKVFSTECKLNRFLKMHRNFWVTTICWKDLILVLKWYQETNWYLILRLTETTLCNIVHLA